MDWGESVGEVGGNGEDFEGDDFGIDFLWGIWGGEVWERIERVMYMICRNGFGVGFWGDVAIGKYSGLVSRCTKSFRENKPPILIGILI